MSSYTSKQFLKLKEIDETNYNELYEMYKTNVSEEILANFGINDLDDFKAMFGDDEGIQSLLDKLTTEKQLEFMQKSGIKKYSTAGRNKKRRSKKRRGNRRKSTRRRSRR